VGIYFQSQIVCPYDTGNYIVHLLAGLSKRSQN
jgi:hypothetical protein